MALGGFEYKKSSDLVPYATSLAKNFEQGKQMTFLSWKLNEEKNTLELTFKTKEGEGDDAIEELAVAYFSDPTRSTNTSQVQVILSQIMELALEMGHSKGEAELQEFIGSSDWDNDLMTGLWDEVLGVTGRGKLTYQAAFKEYDGESPEFTDMPVDEIKKIVTPLIGFGRFPYFYKDGNPTLFKRFVDKKNNGKFSDHIDFVLKRKEATNLGVVGGIAMVTGGDENLFK